MKNLKITGIIGFLFQLIFSVVTVVFVIKLNVLPTFYIFWIVFILTLLLLISGIFIIARSRLRVIIGMVFAFLMSIILAVQYESRLRKGCFSLTYHLKSAAAVFCGCIILTKDALKYII